MATNTKEVRILRKNLTLSDYQRAIIIGSLLGDGHIAGNMGEGKWNINYRFQIAHSQKQKEYLWWKYEILREWCLSLPQYQPQNRAWRFRTISHPEFTKLRNIFYDSQGHKIVPKEQANLGGHPIILAIWFMDDGAKMAQRGYTINSQSFSEIENRLLQQWLKNQFRISVSLHRDKTRKRLYIPKESVKRFEEIVRPFVVASMQYKFL